jgi:hypothetical protein
MIIFTNFYLHSKVSIFLRNDSECKDVDLYNTREIRSNGKFGSYEKHILASKLFL